MLTTAVCGQHPWMDALKAMPEIETRSVTAENRDEVPQCVLEWLKR